MGGFLAALGGITGGVGQAASHYGEQMRSMLEARRKELAESIGAQAASESDPQTRISMYQHQADLLSGKPMGGIMQKFMGTVQKRQTDADTLHAAIGSPQNPQPSELPPGPAMPGSMPGKSVVMMPEQQHAPPPQGLGGFMDMLMKEGQGQQGQGRPAPPVAAQPGSNPIAGAQGPIKAPAPQQQAPALTPLPQTTQQSMGYPTPEDPKAIMDSVYNDPRWAAPANRPLLLAGAQQRLSHQEALRQTLDTQQAQLAMKQAAINRMKQSGAWDSLPPMLQQAYEAEAGGLAAVNSGAMWTPHILAPQVNGKGIAQGQLDAGGAPIDYSGNSDYRKVQYPGSTTPVYELLPPKTVMTDLADGTRGLNNRNTGGSLGPVQGAVAGSQIAPHLITLPNGKMAFSTAADAGAGKAPIQTGGINVGMMPTVSTVQTPGSLPTTTVKTRGSGVGGGTAAPTLTPAPGGGGMAAPSDHSTPDYLKGKETPRSEIAGYVDDVMTGKLAVNQVPAKERNAVQQYLNRNKLSKPEVLSPAAQKSVASIDPVMTEVDGLLTKLNSIKGNPNLAIDYLKYKNGFHTQYDDVFTNLSFESLRSAAAALQGMNSRAYPIISRALAHTPNLDRLGGLNPDSIPLMKDKLQSIKQILKDARSAAIQDERKSGVIDAAPGGASGSTSDPLGIR